MKMLFIIENKVVKRIILKEENKFFSPIPLNLLKQHIFPSIIQFDDWSNDSKKHVPTLSPEACTEVGKPGKAFPDGIWRIPRIFPH
jgi:hypothetical protein